MCVYAGAVGLLSHFVTVSLQELGRVVFISCFICCLYGYCTLIVRLRKLKLGIGCKVFDVCDGCLLYADDILLLSHSVNAMRRMLAICDQFATEFDLKFNTSKSATRIGNRYSVDCAPFTLSGDSLRLPVK